MSRRLNARIDDALAEKLEHLQRHTNRSVTDIVRASIELYYERFRAQRGDDARGVLEEEAFIGCGESDPHLSTEYKTHLHTSLADKASS